MTRLIGLVIPVVSLALIPPASALEPLQRSLASSPVVASTAQPLDLSSEQTHFSNSSKRFGDSDGSLAMPVAPGEKGRPPAGHSLLDLGF